MNKDQLTARLLAKYEFVDAVGRVSLLAGQNGLVAVFVTAEVPSAHGRSACHDETHIGIGHCGHQAFIDLLGKLGAV